MALTHLADTSVLTRLRSPAVREALTRRLHEGTVARAGISDLEVGFSALNGGEWDTLASAVEVLALVETTDDHLRRARHVQRRLADRGLRGRKVPDLLVAAAAEGRGLTVLHYDADFDLIASVTGRPVEWVIPAGSVD